MVDLPIVPTVSQNSKHAIRVAFQDEIITDAENWMEALKKRNLTSHTYNENVLNETMVFLRWIIPSFSSWLSFSLSICIASSNNK
jgi:hypothetical protein